MTQRASRQLNVQQQNARTEAGLRAEASYWRVRGAPLPLAKIGEQMGVQWDRSIILSLDVDFPGMPAYFGLLLTQDERFIDFAIDSEGTRLNWKRGTTCRASRISANITVEQVRGTAPWRSKFFASSMRKMVQLSRFGRQLDGTRSGQERSHRVKG